METYPERNRRSNGRKRRRVLLYGKSLILGTVGMSLQRYPNLEIISLSPPLPKARELGALAPDVIIFDVEAAQPESAMSLLEGRPSLLLIGIDPGGDQTLFWSGQQSRTVTMQDLVQAINSLPDSSNPPSRQWQEDPGEWRGTVRHMQNWAQVGFTRLEQASQFIRQHTTQAEERNTVASASPRPSFRFSLGLSQRTTRILALALALIVLSVVGLLAAGQNNLGQLLGFGH